MNASAHTSKVWASAPLGDLIDYIVNRHHAYARKQLALIGQLLETAAREPAGGAGEYVASLEPAFREFRGNLEAHLRMEEDEIFPCVREWEARMRKGERLAEDPSARARESLARMEFQHEQVIESVIAVGLLASGQAVSEPGRATPSAIAKALEGIEVDLREHMHMENAVLLRRVREMDKRFRQA